jgi:hypothetical protein
MDAFRGETLFTAVTMSKNVDMREGMVLVACVLASTRAGVESNSILACKNPD